MGFPSLPHAGHLTSGGSMSNPCSGENRISASSGKSVWGTAALALLTKACQSAWERED